MEAIGRRKISAAATAGTSYEIRALDDQHDRAAFVCGVEALDRWFHEQAGQSQRKRRTSVWVASEEGKADLPLGYYSLAPFHLAFAEAPPALLKRLPPEPIYVALIARLAVAASARGKGLGGVLLVDALKRAHRASREVPTHAVVVHALVAAPRRHHRDHRPDRPRRPAPEPSVVRRERLRREVRVPLHHLDRLVPDDLLQLEESPAARSVAART